MRLVNWNIERRGPKTWQARSLMAQITDLCPDIVCLTEARATSIEALAGYTMDQRGYRLGGKAEDERLILLWSKTSWEMLPVPREIHVGGGALLGRTHVNGASIVCLGLCIPYHMARMDGEEKTKPWHWHISFLNNLKSWLPELTRKHERLIILGDFNQKIPRRFASHKAYDLLMSTFSGMQIITSGALQPLDEQAIDHVVVSGQLFQKRVTMLDRHDEIGKARSDHHGIFAELAFD